MVQIANFLNDKLKITVSTPVPTYDKEVLKSLSHPQMLVEPAVKAEFPKLPFLVSLIDDNGDIPVDRIRHDRILITVFAILRSSILGS
jgi:hypothetical protein